MIKALLVAIAAFALVAAKDEQPIDPGPAPAFADAVALSTAALKAHLVDPMSAQIEWPYAFTGGWLKAFLGKKQAGWYTCGFVNSKNRMGGYVGRSPVLVLIHGGAIVRLDVGTIDGVDSATITCGNLLKQGLLQPAPVLAAIALPSPAQVAAAASATATEAAQGGGIGIAWLPSAFGASLQAVAPGSPAEKAGLKPGETIEAVNGISLRGMEQDAIRAVLAGATGTLTFSVVGVGQIKVR